MFPEFRTSTYSVRDAAEEEEGNSFCLGTGNECGSHQLGLKGGLKGPQKGFGDIHGFGVFSGYPGWKGKWTKVSRAAL